MANVPCVVLNAPEYLEDVYMRFNQYHTKHDEPRNLLNILMPTSLFLLNTDDPHYPEKRKILASAFYKNKVTRMINLIKKVTSDFINDLVAKGTQQIDIVKMTQDLQSKIIINLSVGPSVADRTVDYENTNGSISQIYMFEYITSVIDVTFVRNQMPINLLFPELLPYAIQLDDRRCARNIMRLRKAIRLII